VFLAKNFPDFYALTLCLVLKNNML